MSDLEQSVVECCESARSATGALRDLSDSLRTLEELRVRRASRVELYTELAVALQMEANTLATGDPRIGWLFDQAARFTRCACEEAGQ